MNEAELLFTEVLNCDRVSLYQNYVSRLSQDSGKAIAATLKRRIKGEPIQYILGKAEFMGLEFKVTPDVLIPRPETEILVETAISYAQRCEAKRSLPEGDVEILDIGTGCGCVAISLAKLEGRARLTAIEISPKALTIAKENALFHSVADRINFLESDLFSGLTPCDMRYALCVCNPPYIPSGEISELQAEVQYEPRIALDGGADGLNFYRRILSQSKAYLKKDGLLIMEVGFNQIKAIKEIIRQSAYQIEEIVKDYNQIERVIVARKKYG